MGGSGATDGGGDAAVACETAADCDNGLACDGIEQCVSHVCAAGSPVDCSGDNPDSLHCTATCIEPGGACDVQANDLDGDKHFDPDCPVTASPQDDCDDSEATVYPGADEICDGLDNDCDGQGDFTDGQVLSGTSDNFVVSPTAAVHPAIAWSSAEQKYGVVWEDTRDGIEEVYFTLMSPQGDKVGSEIRVSNAPKPSITPRIAWGNNSWGVVWSDRRNADADIYFSRLDATGSAIAAEKRLTTDTALSETPDILPVADGWIIVLSDSPAKNLMAIRIDLDGGVVKPKAALGPQTGQNAVPRVALLGNEFGVMWSELGSTTAQFRTQFLVSDFDFSVSKQTALSPVVAANKGGLMGDLASDPASGTFRAAWFNKDLPEYSSYAELDAQGVVVCGPVSGGSSITVGGHGEIVPFEGGSVGIITNGVGANTAVAVVVYPSGCSQILPAPIDTATINEINPYFSGAAAGEAGVALIWQDSAKKALRRRTMGPHLCD